MASAPDLNASLRASLRSAGAATSAQLQRACGVSQATMSRALAPLLAAGEVLAVGRGPNRAYVMPRAVEGVGTTGSIPVIKVDADGAVSEFATLIPAAGGRCWIEEYEEPLTQLHDGLPWFLADMRPQGFLGRSFAQLHQHLRLADNPDHWSDDDTLKALCQVGDDLPGNLILGAQAFARFNSAAPPPRVAPPDYVALADAAMRGALPGSSAGGEQPKFCAVREDGQPVIVKFSPAGDAPFDCRWDDLLVCEHLALTVLHEGGIPAARSRVFRQGGRTLLEVERFDRTRAGRIGMVSLMSFDNEYIGQIDNWAATAERLRLRGLLVDEDVAHLRFLEAFGLQIGNTDRHYGNISLVIGANGSWRLAPAYDVLPMVYAPVGGELVPRDFNPGRLAPSAETLREWPRARALAARYWERVAGEALVSEAFRVLAARHAASLRGSQPTPH